MPKRGYKGINHKNSMKHLNRFIAEFEGRDNLRELSSNRQIQAFTEKSVEQRLKYNDFASGEDGRVNWEINGLQFENF